MTTPTGAPKGSRGPFRDLLPGAGRLVARMSPRIAAAYVERAFFTPPPPRRSRGEAVLASAEPFDLRLEGRTILGWAWGTGPTVVLVHGWGGRAAQLTSFVAPLLDLGFSVVTFDAPGHGRSGRGLSSAPEFARALLAVARMRKEIHAVVAHSLGAAATALALKEGLAVSRVVLVAPVANPADWAKVVLARLGLGGEVLKLVRERSEQRIGISWDRLHVPALAPSFSVPALVVHDEGDREVPFMDGQAIAAAWPDAEFVATRGLGHSRGLRDPAVVERAAAFIAPFAFQDCVCGHRILKSKTLCESCDLERRLFDREGRREASRVGSA